MANTTLPFLWLHIKKSAGTSFRDSFTPPYVQTKNRETHPKPFITAPKEEWNDILNAYRIPLGEYDYKRMLFAQKFLYSEEEFKQMYKFVIVRNPYDRAVSCWKFLFRPRQTDIRYMLMKYSFSYFASQLPRILKNYNQQHRRLAMHVAPVWSDITDEKGTLLVDDIFKLENINHAIESINQKLGTNIKTFSKKNVNRSNNDYRKYYNAKTRKLIEEIYKDDIEHLGYSF